jgi:hypothetical protein
MLQVEKVSYLQFYQKICDSRRRSRGMGDL